MRRRIGRGGTAVMAALVLVLSAAACDVRAAVDIEVEPDGSGTVAVTVDLDREAAAQVPDLEQSLLVADLESTGWTLTGPTRRRGGGLRIVARRPFRDPDELTAVMDQISGDEGGVDGFRLEREHRFAATTYRVTGTIDLRRGIDALADPELRFLLGGSALGRPPEELERLAGGPLEDHVHFVLRVDLPGEEGGAPRREDGAGVWAPELGDPPVEVDTSSTRRAPLAWLLALLAAVCAVLAVAVVTWIVRQRRIERPPSYVHIPGAPHRSWDDR